MLLFSMRLWLMLGLLLFLLLLLLLLLFIFLGILTTKRRTKESVICAGDLQKASVVIVEVVALANTPLVP